MYAAIADVDKITLNSVETFWFTLDNQRVDDNELPKRVLNVCSEPSLDLSHLYIKKTSDSQLLQCFLTILQTIKSWQIDRYKNILIKPYKSNINRLLKYKDYDKSKDVIVIKQNTYMFCCCEDSWAANICEARALGAVTNHYVRLSEIDLLPITWKFKDQRPAKLDINQYNSNFFRPNLINFVVVIQIFKILEGIKTKLYV